MKRPRSGSKNATQQSSADGMGGGDAHGLDVLHPAMAFHREVWVGDYWHVVREQFRMEYEDVFVHGRRAAPHSGVVYRSTVAEPAKFWRHCREALAKWVLSQIARYQPFRKAEGDNGVVDYDALNAIHFLPSDAMMSSAYFTSATAQGQQQEEDGAVSQRRRTYDLQLIRDLTFKSIESLRNTATFIADVQRFVEAYDLPARCARAVHDIEAQVEMLMRRSGKAPTATSGGPPVGGARGHLLKPLIRRIADKDKTTPAQHRIAGDLVEVGVQWPEGYATDAVLCCDVKQLSRSTNNVRPVLVSAASWDRLHRCYTAFGAPRDVHSGYVPEAADADHQAALLRAFADLRAAVVVLRYEHCLASGSLQLCADSSLKMALNRHGYNVMDLCASPINAYMVDLQHSGSSSGSIAPRRFCSAFWDTDFAFGSMGSALLFDVHGTYSAFRRADEALCTTPAGASQASARPLHQEAPDAPLLLTLDVPYDEDLCELLFLKLAHDCKRFVSAQHEGHTTSLPADPQRPKWVDFVLVLPLWWNVAFDIERCPKRFVSDTASATTTSTSPADTTAMWALVNTHSDYLKQGHQIAYRWLRELPAAVFGDVSDDPEREGGMGGRGRARSPYAAVFDAVFIRDSYTYFCTATNKPLTGVTATEVIGISLAPPDAASAANEGARGDLKHLLCDFYHVAS